MEPDLLWQVTAPRFCAGLITRGDLVVDAAPILRRACLGRTRAHVREHARRQGWTIRHVPEQRAAQVSPGDPR